MKYVLLGICCWLSTSLLSQNLSLDMVLAWTKAEALGIQQAQGNVEIAQQEARFLRASLLPQIGVNAQVPQYFKTTSPITQPNGSVTFTDVIQNNASVGVGATQVISRTGGTVFLNSNLRRFDDFSNDIIAYNGAPLLLGISQPLFGFNPFKFDKKIVEVRTIEVEKQYTAAVASAYRTASERFFEWLLAQENIRIATTNLTINQKLMAIADERLALGKISKDEWLQLQMEVNNAQRNQWQAESAQEQAVFNLEALVGKNKVRNTMELSTPLAPPSLNLTMEQALDKAMAFQPAFWAFERQRLQVERNLAEDKAAFGLQADVNASIGYVRGSNRIEDIYRDPVHASQVAVSVALPIVDWGRKEARLQQRKVEKMRLDQSKAQTARDLERDLRSSMMALEQWAREITLLESIKSNATERFDISNQRYILGNISITDLTIAQREKDQAQRAYTSAMASYWMTYFDIQLLIGG